MRYKWTSGTTLLTKGIEVWLQMRMKLFTKLKLFFLFWLFCFNCYCPHFPTTSEYHILLLRLHLVLPYFQKSITEMNLLEIWLTRWVGQFHGEYVNHYSALNVKFVVKCFSILLFMWAMNDMGERKIFEWLFW